jgi:uncharacterized membrane protein/uncharacterized RDD family membrane protein YckC
MADAQGIAYVLLLVVLYFFLPLGLMGTLFLLSRKYRGMFDEIGFSRKEMGLLIVGSLSTLLVPSEVPLVLYKNYFLAVNLGGAIIPTVLSIHLLSSKRIPFLVWGPSILAVSCVTFLVTRVQPNAGIVAEFPYMFLPAVAAATMSLVLYSRSSPRAPALAYATATLGSLIGADVFHLPELFQASQFVGSIGGAGVFDLVYIGGIVSFALVLVFATRRLRKLKATLPHAEVARERVLSELRNAVSAIMNGRYQLAAQRALGAVQERLKQLGRSLGRTGTYPVVLQSLVPDPNVSHAYDAIARYANVAELDFHSARWAIQQAQALLERLQAVERTRYAGPALRAGAFFFDALLMAGLVLLLGVGLLVGANGVADNRIVVYALIFWAIMVQVVYFTVFEHFWKGRTPGKRLFGLRVVEIGDFRPTFITTFTRNAIRLLDFALLGYGVSLILIAVSDRSQRIGDRIAETVVLKDRRLEQEPAPQAIYSPVS